MSTRRGPAIAAIAGVLACSLLAAAVLAGARMPGLEVLSGLGPATVFDYARLSERVSPLSEAFIERELGLERGPVGGASPGPGGSAVPKDAVPGARAIIEHPLTNDDFERAYPVASIPFTAKTDASGATRQSAEPRGCAPIGDRTIWYRYRPAHDLGLIANTFGTTHATSVAIFTGSRLADLEPLSGRCHTNVRGNASVAFPARAGTTYQIQVTGVADGGPTVFNLDPLGSTTKVSGGDSASSWPAMSANGRYVAFMSGSTDLVANDDNGVEDVFVRDLRTGAIERVSISSSGEEARGGESKPWYPSLSADGRYVAFTSDATNLVPGDRNGANDVFVHDRVTRRTTMVSVSSTGAQGMKPNGGLGDPAFIATASAQERFDDYSGSWLGASISGDGRYVAFESDLTGLTPGDGPDAERSLLLAGMDVFVHDRRTGRTTLVSASAGGENGDGWSRNPEISADGRFVAFQSSASNLVPGYRPAGHAWTRTATTSQVYVRDLRTGAIELASVSSDGAAGDDLTFDPVISADGRYVAFFSVASNLVPGDDNEGIDVFIRDRLLGRTELVTLSSAGEQQIAGESYERTMANAPRPAISADGRFVAFHSDAPNLVPGDTDESENVAGRVPVCDVQNEDVFVRDRLAGTTTRVSVSSDGTKANGASVAAIMSGDGHRIGFASVADNLDPGDRASVVPMSCFESIDVFVHTFPVLR